MLVVLLRKVTLFSGFRPGSCGFWVSLFGKIEPEFVHNNLMDWLLMVGIAVSRRFVVSAALITLTELSNMCQICLGV